MKREDGFATLGTIAGFGGVGAAAACCVLPLALTGLGLGASGLAMFVPLHTPLTAIALLAVAAGWYFYAKRRQACAKGMDCTPPDRKALPLLTISSLLVAISAIWPLIEAPLMGLIA